MFENNSVYSEKVLDFVRSATEFVDFAESIDSFSRVEFLDKSLVLIPQIYPLLMSLPRFEQGGEVVKYCSQYDWDRVQNFVSKQLGEYESYFDLTETNQFETGETVNLSTSETFSDLYQSLFDFISFYRVTNEEGIQAALAEIIADFNNFLGVRMLRLTEELHLIRFGSADLADDDSEHYNNYREE